MFLLLLLTACGDPTTSSVDDAATSRSRTGSRDASVSLPEPDADPGTVDGTDAATPDPVPDSDASEPSLDASDDVQVVVRDASRAVDAADGSTPPTGNTGFFGAPRCGQAGVALCEDFESARVDPAVWTVETATARVTVETTHAARGRYALHVHAGNTAGSHGFVHERRTFPALARHLFGRMFVYFERATPDYNFVLASATGPLSGGGTAAYNLGGQTAPWGSATGMAYFRFGYHPGDLIKKSTEPVPLDRWVCMEWEYRGASNEMLFWRDERAITAMSVTGAERPVWTAPSFTDLAIGYHTAHPTSESGIDVWIDEIAVDSARIGCSR